MFLAGEAEVYTLGTTGLEAAEVTLHKWDDGAGDGVSGIQHLQSRKEKALSVRVDRVDT